MGKQTSEFGIKATVILIIAAIMIGFVVSLVLIAKPSNQRNDHGFYPNPNLTPGATNPDATATSVCKPNQATTARKRISRNMRITIFRAYGLSWPQEPAAYELDHLIPLELGGSNDIKNLWPEAALPRPGYHEKDRVENYLHREVCAGRLSLTEAQERIQSNWYAVYQTLH